VQNSLYCDPSIATEPTSRKRNPAAYARGEKIGCYALTEPQAGSNAAAANESRQEGDNYGSTAQADHQRWRGIGNRLREH